MTTGAAQHAAYFGEIHFKVGQQSIDLRGCLLWTGSPAASFARGRLVCLLWPHRAETHGHETAALSANCLWVAFKFIDSPGDIVFLLFPWAFVNKIKCDSCSASVVSGGCPGAREQRDAQRGRPLRGQERGPSQVPRCFS